MAESRLGRAQRLMVPDTVHARMFDEEMILLDLDAGEYYSLDTIGSMAWNGFAAGQTAEAIATDLTNRCDVAFDQALDDVLALGTELVSRGLLVAG